MKKLILLVSCALFFQCKTSSIKAAKTALSESNAEVVAISSAKLIDSTKTGLEATDPSTFAKTITATELKEKVYQFAADSMQGRATGSEGQKKAALLLRKRYKELGIASPDSLNYFQKIPAAFFNGRAADSENVIAYIKGAEKPEEYLVLSAHYDHIGMTDDGIVFNGADDDASGTMGLVEIAEAFVAAQNAGQQPKRSVVFLHVAGEEIGLYGSKYYTDYPIFPLDQTIADLNVDMIGRVDEAHTENKNYVYLIGSDRLSLDLHTISENVNKAYSNFDLDYKFNDKNDPNRFYFRSDHYNFAKNDIPIIFYFNGVHEDYHKVSDTPDKIDYDLLAERCKLIFNTAWELANRKDRPQLNGTDKQP